MESIGTDAAAIEVLLVEDSPTFAFAVRQALQVAIVEYDDVVKQVATDGVDQAFDIRVLPR